MGNLIKAWVAGAVVFIVPSLVWYELLMGERYAEWEAALMRGDVTTTHDLVGFAGVLLVTLMMAVMYPKGYQGGNPMQEGARFGAMIGLVVVGLFMLIYSVWEVAAAGAIADSLFNLVLLALVGAAIGWAYGEMGPRHQES